MMSDAKSNLKTGVDNAADKAKELGGKAIDKTKDAAAAVGNKAKEVGEKIKDGGK
jgi:hypothetical protein